MIKLDNLIYIKADRGSVTIEGRSLTKKNVIQESDEVLDSKEPTVPADYQKEMPTIDVSRFFVVSGGTKRERDYFEQFKSSKRLSIIFVSQKGQGLKPEDMVREAMSSIEDESFCDYYGTIHTYLDGDKIFLIQDVDHFGKELKEFYLRDNSQEPYKWIISNPCLEIWLYYHFNGDVTCFQKCIEMIPKDRSGWLKREVDNVVKGGINPKNVIDKTQSAINNAKKHIAFDKDGYPELFMTEMYIVAEEISSTIKDELPDLIHQRTEEARLRREKYMK